MAEDKKSRKPRVRKVETVRERSEKLAAKAEKKASRKPKLTRTRKIFGALGNAFATPISIITWPFRLRPVRWVGRLLGRILWPRYFRNAWKEVRQVTWPSRGTTWKLTFAVLVFAVLFGLAAAGIDWVLDKIIRRIVFRA